MYSYPSSLVKSYVRSYTGLEKSCYRGILLSLIESIFIGVYYYLSIYFIGVLHYDMASSGLIISCYGVGAILGGMLGGKFSDELSPRFVLVCSLLLQSIAYFAFIKIQSMYLLMCNVFILGVASYGFITANHLWVLNSCQHSAQRLKAINLLATTSNLGLGLSAMMMSEVIQFGFHTIFFVSGCFLFLMTCVSFVYDKTATSLASNHSSDQDNVSGDNDPVISRQPKKIITILILANVFFIGLIVAQISSTYVIYIRDSYPNFGVKAISFLFALNSFMVVLLGAILGDYIKRYNNIWMVGVGGFLIGLGMFTLTFSYTFAIAIVACIIYTIGEIMFFSMAQLVCYQNGLENKKGHSLGLYRMIYASSRVLGPAVGGMIYPIFSGRLVWIISGFIGLFSLIFCHYYKKYD